MAISRPRFCDSPARHAPRAVRLVLALMMALVGASAPWTPGLVVLGIEEAGTTTEVEIEGEGEEAYASSRVRRRIQARMRFLAGDSYSRFAQAVRRGPIAHETGHRLSNGLLAPMTS